ncbi:2651_t:CDS:2 [Entrophospora sp. SA101]|nr:3579_t:CDS:2 [Entrophospora sp. SA101]CAJ0757968.1 2651_t:CDS:2 [Entrophospora sp. SA101]
MSTILTAIVFVKSVNGSRTLSGTATAGLDDDEYVDIQCKAFNVIVNKSTLLDLKTIEDEPTIYDLPISPLYGVITAPCVTPSKNQNDKHYFTMSRRTYNPFKGGYTSMDIPCFYDPDNGRHGGVPNATKNGKQIFTVAGEC